MPATGIDVAACAAQSKVIDIVQLIVGSDPAPAWLEPGIDAAVHALRWAIREEEEQLTRAADRESIEALRDGARCVFSTLHDHRVMDTLNALGGDDLSADNQAHHALLSLIARAERALGAVPVGRGRHKSNLGSSPEAVCAILMVVAWRGVWFRPPGHTASRTNNACNLLWEAATGEALPIISEPEKRWLAHIRKANLTLSNGDRDGHGQKASQVLGLPWPLAAEQG